MNDDTQELKSEDFITKTQLQEWLGITAAQRTGWHDTGLPYIRIGNTTLYHVPEVCRFLKCLETRRPSE